MIHPEWRRVTRTGAVATVRRASMRRLSCGCRSKPIVCCRCSIVSSRLRYRNELRSLLRACPQQGYDAIFAAGSATIQKLLANPKWLDSPNVGFFGVLHTWGRDRVKWLAWLFLGWTFWLGSGAAPQPDRYVSKRPLCEHCGGMLHIVAITDSSGRVLISREVPQPALADRATNYLDSG